MENYFERIDTVFLYVRNLEDSIQWYTTKLGLNLRWNMEGYAALDVGKGETPLTLIQVPDENITVSDREQFNFFAPNIDSVYKALIENGVEVSQMNMDGAVKYFTFKDPDGNILGACYFD